MLHLGHAYQKSITRLYKMQKMVIAMPMYNLLEYSESYSMTSGSLWNYYWDKMNDDANENNDAGNYRINNNKNNREHTSW